MSEEHMFVICLSKDIKSNALVLLHAINNNQKIMLYTHLWDNDPRELWEIPEARELFWNTLATVAVNLDKENMKHSADIILSRLDDETKELMKAMLLVHDTKKSKPTPPWCH